MSGHQRRLWRGLIAALLVVAALVIPSDPVRADSGTITFDAASTPVASEADGLLGTTIDLSRDNTVDEVTVDYTITATTGTFDGDFSLDGSAAASGTVTFAAGQAVVSLAVIITDDINGEGPAGTETFDITLSNPQNVDAPLDLYALGAITTHSLSITDNGQNGTIVFSAASSIVAETDTDDAAPISVTRTGGTEGAATATVSSTGGSATSGVDYTAVNDVVNFAHGDGSAQNAFVTITGDNESGEGSETIEFTLSGPDAGAGVHTMTITDDDQPGAVRFAAASLNPSVFESEASITLTFERIGGNDGTVSINYATADITALNGLDYTSTVGTLDFLQGITSLTVDIPILGDVIDEFDESFQVTISGDTTGPVVSVVTIQDEDDPLAAIFDSYTSPEDTIFESDVSVLANDTGPGGVDLDVQSFGTPTAGTLTAVDLEEGHFTYEPPENFEGQVFFSYVLTDGTDTTSGTVRITVTDSNAAPVANDDEYPNVTRADSTELPVLENDTDQDGNDLTILTGVEATALGNSVDCTSGTVCVFTPVEGFVGADTFVYTIEDTLGAVDTATATVLVGMPRACDVIATPGVPLIGTNADEVLCGTPGDDVIDGGGGEDVILGFAGNDTLSGGTGKDRIAGGPGDDMIMPGSGDNDDTIGGDGIDTVTYIANDPQADTVVVSETAISIVSSGGNDGDLHESVELIVVELRGGDDAVTVQAGDNAAIDLRGGDGTDRLSYDTTGLTGVSDSGSVITADGKQPVTHSSFEIRLTESVIILGTPGNEFWFFSSSQPEGLIIDPLGGADDVTIGFGSLQGPVSVSDSGLSDLDSDHLTTFGSPASENFQIRPVAVETATETVTFSNIEVLDVLGNGGDDTFTLDVDAGFAPSVFSLEVTVNGGTGTDTLRLTSDNACTLDGNKVIVEDIATFEVVAVEVLHTTCNGIVLIQSFASGYWLVDAIGRVSAFNLNHYGDHTTSGGTSFPVTGIADRPDKLGYWTVQSNGDVTPFGSATDFGDLPSIAVVPAFDIVGMTSTPSGNGYYLLGLDGGVFSFGDAIFYGSTGEIALDLPVTAMAANPAGEGYWFVARDGGMFTYGPQTSFHGSVPELVPYAQLAADIVGMAPTATGLGYWLVAADGGVFAFGDAQFFGSVPGALPPGTQLDQPIVGIVATPTGLGYWIVAADGGVFTFGDAAFFGSLGGGGNNAVVALAG